MIAKEDLGEFKGQLIDIFEDFLDAHGVSVKNEEKETDENLDPETCAIIYGSHYDELCTAIENVLSAWGQIDSGNRESIDVQVVNLYNRDIAITYTGVSTINEVCNDDGNLYYEICTESGCIASYPIMDWLFYVRDWRIL